MYGGRIFFANLAGERRRGRDGGRYVMGPPAVVMCGSWSLIPDLFTDREKFVLLLSRSPNFDKF